jgi:hypothetical protein
MTEMGLLWSTQESRGKWRERGVWEWKRKDNGLRLRKHRAEELTLIAGILRTKRERDFGKR